MTLELDGMKLVAPGIVASLLLSGGPAFAEVMHDHSQAPQAEAGDVHAEEMPRDYASNIVVLKPEVGMGKGVLWPQHTGRDGGSSARLLLADAETSKAAGERGAALDPEHAIAKEVLDLVDQHFFDLNNQQGTLDSVKTHVYNSISWDQVRGEFEKKPLKDREQSYKEISKLVSRLGDKYTRFLPPKEFVKLTKYDQTGVGLLLVQRGGSLFVSAPPLVSSTAAEAKVQKGDRILSIDGVDTTTGKSPFEGAELLSGIAGTSAKVELERGGSKVSVSLERKISVENPVTTYVVTAKDGCRVGYMKLKEFNGACKRGITSAVKELKAEGVDSYVLDLRGNLGGVLEGSLEIAGLFVDEPSATEKRTIVYVQDRSGKEEPIWAQPRVSFDTTTPIFVLVDKKSASASEVLAGSLQSNCRAVIVGKENSYGKGLIQGAFPLTDGSGVVMTVAKYLTPNMGEIQGTGVVPDFKINVGDARKAIQSGKLNLKEAQSKLAACVPPPPSKEDAGGGRSETDTTLEQLNGDQGQRGEQSLAK